MNWIISKSRITEINILGVPVVSYGFNVIKWNLNEITKIGKKTIKLLTSNKMHHFKAESDRLYMPRSIGDLDMTQ